MCQNLSWEFFWQLVLLHTAVFSRSPKGAKIVKKRQKLREDSNSSGCPCGHCQKASCSPAECSSNLGTAVIGHSAGSFSAMVILDILQDPKFGPFFGCTRATAIAIPSKLFETHYTQRKIHLYHVLEGELCLWRPMKKWSYSMNFFFFVASAFRPVWPGRCIFEV